ncbi:hypothetical protein FHU37_003935 [Allostreptomyces psammosilenae]|uniref:TIGR01777 family protein n=2 Tax=Allostreptomyces psammosilenae TaxID=1892865 RepID=A0A853A9A0_9ACTN|nr:hypothetical protein [Allostreptomyces psammosilenae]
MRIAVTGSSGLIGTALTTSLLRDGHEVIRLVRRDPRSGPRPDGSTEARWDPRRQWVDLAALDGVEAIAHLAGAGVGDRRWSEAYKREIRDSRVLGTCAIAEAAAALEPRPRVLASGSAIGYYGDTGDRPVDETHPPGEGFLAQVCQDWEEATRPAEEAGVRTVHLRTGLVVSRSGGAWGRLFPIFRAGLGGRLGSGRQFWSYISMADEIAAIRHVMFSAELHGPVNLTAPEPVTNREVTAAMGEVLRRPTLLAVPAPALRLALGDFADDVLGSQRVRPRALLESGFRFRHTDVRDAIRAALADG